MIRTSAIVLNWNGRHFLEECLASLLAQSRADREFLLVDNGSSDGSQEWVRRHYPSVRLIENGSNLGFSKAVNLGVRASRGRFIALFNNDLVLAPGWFDHMEQALAADPGLGLAACKMLNYRQRQLIDSAGNVFCLFQTLSRGRLQPDLGQYDRATAVFGACAGAALYRRELFEQLGGFDEDFFMSHEDNDLSFRAALAGYRAHYVPQARCYHHDHGTNGEMTYVQTFYGLKNMLLLVAKDIPLPFLLRHWPRFLATALREALAFAFAGQSRAALAALAAFARQLPLMLGKRVAIQSGKRLSDDEVARLLAPSE